MWLMAESPRSHHASRACRTCAPPRAGPGYWVWVRFPRSAPILLKSAWENPVTALRRNAERLARRHIRQQSSDRCSEIGNQSGLVAAPAITALISYRALTVAV